MGMLPVPEEVKDMRDKIDRMMAMTADHYQMLQRILGRLDDLKRDDSEMAAVRLELTEVRNSLSVIKDCLRFDHVA
jgi:hypothetical protein